MVQIKTILKILDNSGAIKGSCIKVINGKKCGFFGDKLILAVVRRKISSLKNSKVILEGSIQQALIVKTKKNLRFIDGSLLKHDLNAVILLNSKNNPIGNRINSHLIFYSQKKNWFCPFFEKEKELFYKIRIISLTNSI